MQRLLIACHKITMSAPGVGLDFTGRYTSAGDPIMRKASIGVRAGSFFEFEEGPELLGLIESGAARYPEEFELLAYQQDNPAGA